MFMKCFKKKLATGFVVVSMVCSFGSSAFAVEAQEGQCRGVWHNEGFEVIKCKIDGKEYIIANKLRELAGISIIQVK